MQPAPQLHVEWVDDEAVVLDPATGELHYLNSSAALFYAHVLEYGYDDAVVRIRSVADEAELDDLVKEMVERGILIE